MAEETPSKGVWCGFESHSGDMTTYKRYRWKRKVAGTKWVAHTNGWVNVATLDNIKAKKDYWDSNSWSLTARTSSGQTLTLRVPRSVREDVANLNREREVVSRYLKWVHATPEFSEEVTTEDATEDDELETTNN